jgi:heat shock protein HslJ
MIARVIDRNRKLDVESFELRTGQHDDPNLVIKGHMSDILNRDMINSSFTFEADTALWLEKLYEHTLHKDHRLKGKAALTGSWDHLSLRGKAQFGNTHFMTNLDLIEADERRRIVASISAPKIYLDDFGIYPEGPETEHPVQKTGTARGNNIFSDEPLDFPALKDLDLSLRLDIEEITGRGFTFNDLDFNLSLKDGLMRIGPLRAIHGDGFLAMESTLDVRGPNPEMKLTVTARDINTAALFEYSSQLPLMRGGQLALAVDLRSTGSSPREIASALSGEMGLTVERGQIKGIADLIGADAIDFLMSVRQMDAYQDLNCLALVFNFDDGTGTSQVMYVNTPRVRSRGSGTVDLREETINLVIQSNPQRRIGGSSAVTISGPLDSPTFRTVPVVEAARLSAEIFAPHIFLPVRALEYTWSLMRNERDEEIACPRLESQVLTKGQKVFSRYDLGNLTYRSTWTRSGVAQLRNGEYREPAAPGSAIETWVILTDQSAYGDLNGQPAAAVVLSTDPGGSGTFYDLAIVVYEEGKLTNVVTANLGDRVKIHSISLDNNEVAVDMSSHGPDDAMCCPMKRMVQRFTLKGEKLLRVGHDTLDRQDVRGITWKWQQTLYNNDTRNVPLNPGSYILKLMPDGRVFVHADCNVGSGNYRLNNGQINIELTHTTMAACPEDSLQDEFIRDLTGAAIYFMKGDNLFLDLKYDSGTMKFSK